MKAKHPGSWTCTICSGTTRYGEWPKCKHGPIPRPMPEIKRFEQGEIVQRIADLEEWRPILIKYLEAKCKAEDWHGAQDAASDLRDLDCELSGLTY